MEIAAVEEVGYRVEDGGGNGAKAGTNRFAAFQRVTKRAAIGTPETDRPGEKMFIASTSSCYDHTPVDPGDDNFQVYHKVFEGLKTPFDLPIECFPVYEKMLEEDGTSVDIVNTMLRGPVAESTAAGYKTVINRFNGFCAERGFEFPNFKKEAVLRFMHDSYAEGAGMAFFAKIIPALRLLETVLDVEYTELSPQVCGAANSLRRERAKTRGIVKKATGYSYIIISDLIQREVLVHEDNLERVDAFNFRSLVRAVIIYFTFCRFDDYSRITDREVTDEGTYIKIIFCRSKNDQFGDNSISVIPERPGCAECPVRLIRMYFRRFGLRFGGTGKLLNFRLKKEAGRHLAIGEAGICASNATKYTRKLLDKHGYESKSFTEKSMKVQGVTELLDTGESIINVMVLGRWKCQVTPLHYRNLSMKFRLGVAINIPVS
jgi:hypothetical protein